MNWLVLDKTDWAVADVATKKEAKEIAKDLHTDPLWEDRGPFRVIPNE